MSVRESAVLFGRDTTLVGVVSSPPTEQFRNRPAILLLNAGLIHRVGPGRLYVRLARALAAEGFLTLRFDLPGRGDSDVRRGGDSVAMTSLSEVEAAMDLLKETKGITRFIVAGICSGAAASVEAARHHPAVVGAVLINPYAYPTARSRAIHYLRRLGRGTSWWNTLMGRNAMGRALHRALGRSGGGDEMLKAHDESGAPPPRQAAADMLRAIVQRGVQVFVVYSGGSSYNYRRQFDDAFSDVDFRGNVVVEYLPEADHTFTRLISQGRLEAAVVRWVCDHFEDRTVGVSTEASQPGSHAGAEHGQERLAQNVLWSWSGHVVFVASGFIMPRLIDRELGQTSLGLWDFCWSLVSYFNLAQIGIGGSVNRHVAGHRALGDVAALNRTVSSVMAVQLIASAVVLALTAGAVTLLPSLFAERLGDAIGDARWIVGLLGASLAFQLSLHVFRGVLTGCHRWDLHNQVDGVFHGLSAVAMMVALVGGAGLRTLAAITVGGQALTELVRARLAYRVCPELQIRPRHAELREAGQLLAFGGKLSMASIAEMILVQTNSVLVLSYLGVGSLALYSRPVGLIRHVNILAKKLSAVLVPTAGSLQSAGRYDALRELLHNSTRYTAFALAPILTLLAVMGDPILELWMGGGYKQGGLLALLAAGYLLPLTQQPAGTILIGLNRHGVPAAVGIVAAIVGVAASALTVGRLGWGLMGAALSVAAAFTVVGAVVPICACRALDLSVWSYLRRSYTQPLLALMPFSLTLLVCRMIWYKHPLVAVSAGVVAGGAVLLPLYWAWAIPPRFKRAITRRLDALWSPGNSSQEARPDATRGSAEMVVRVSPTPRLEELPFFLRLLHRSRRVFKRGNPLFFWNQFVIVELVSPRVPMRFSSRETQLADNDDIDQLCQQEPEKAEVFRRRIQRGEECLVVKADSRIVARVWCQRDGAEYGTNAGFAFVPPRRPSVWCHDLKIDPAYRMRGDFVLLMERAARPIDQERATVYGEIHVSNYRSLQSHQRLGFEIVRRITMCSALGTRLYLIRDAARELSFEWNFGYRLPHR
jgi:O-antigen/teichoic acid export membrane protein/pimeloyl-ACP methyl ester carboxylesterase